MLLLLIILCIAGSVFCGMENTDTLARWRQNLISYKDYKNEVTGIRLVFGFYFAQLILILYHWARRLMVILANQSFSTTNEIWKSSAHQSGGIHRRVGISWRQTLNAD
jgi:hypothetical protein